jgi:hypothetical protein
MKAFFFRTPLKQQMHHKSDPPCHKCYTPKEELQLWGGGGSEPHSTSKCRTVVPRGLCIWDNEPRLRARPAAESSPLSWTHLYASPVSTALKPCPMGPIAVQRTLVFVNIEIGTNCCPGSSLSRALQTSRVGLCHAKGGFVTYLPPQSQLAPMLGTSAIGCE